MSKGDFRNRGSGSSFGAVKLNDHVYWVGAVDWTLRDFHGYATDRGTTYNAYLVMADKITLIDTVKAPFCGELLSRIASVVDPGKIDYIVSNHAEMDHSGALPEVIARVKPEKVFASAKGVEALQAHFHWDQPVTAVQDGDTLSLGNRTLSFVLTKMLHWPDSMFSYLVEDRLLFAQDAFGMHLASSERFADELDKGVLEYEAAKYYANIVLPFSAIVKKTIEKAAAIDIATIAPDHGPIWRRDLEWILGLYARWADQAPNTKAVIVYDTMWGSTGMMAREIEEGLVSEGMRVRSMRLRESHRSDVATEVLEAGALLVGSPTINNNLFPTVADVLSYLKGLRPKNLAGAAFGSYGWSGEGAKQVAEALASMRVDLVGDPINTEYVPDLDALARCRDLGVQVGQKMKQRVTL